MFPSRKGRGKILLVLGLFGFFTVPISSTVTDWPGTVGELFLPIIFICGSLALMYSRDKITTFGMFLPAIFWFFSAAPDYPLNILTVIIGIFAGAFLATRKRIGLKF